MSGAGIETSPALNLTVCIWRRSEMLGHGTAFYSRDVVVPQRFGRPDSDVDDAEDERGQNHVSSRFWSRESVDFPSGITVNARQYREQATNDPSRGVKLPY